MHSLARQKHWCKAAVMSLGLLAAVPLLATAQPSAATAATAEHAVADSGPGEGRMCQGHQQKMADELKLDDKQRALFGKAMQQVGESMHANMTLHEKLKGDVEADDFDEKKVRDIVHKHQAVTEDQMVAAARAMHDFYQSLGPWQQGKFKSIKDDMHDRMREHMQGERREHRHGHRHAGSAAAQQEKPAVSDQAQ